MFVTVAWLGAGLYAGGIAAGQSAMPQARIVEAVQNEKVVALRGNVHPMARTANDRGSLQDQQSVTRIHVLLQRGAEEEAALEKLMADQLDPNSPSFHKWLTPQEFGQKFGPAESDLQAVKSWLRSQGFSGLKVNNGRTMIEFNGTAGQVRNAFHTELHRVSANGEEHFANMQEPQIPSALAPVLTGVVGLHNFRRKPMIHRLGKFRRDAKTGEVTPLFTFTDVNGTFFGVGPADFKTIYNVPSGFDGTGQSIAIVGQTNINIQDVRDFRTIFGLPANDPQIILNGADPGLVSGDEGESDLDVEWSGAVAPHAKIILVATGFTQTDGLGGVDSSAEYIVDNNVAPILSESYGSCESNLGTAGNGFYNALWQQAAAQGITVIASAGDNGPSACDDPNSETSAKSGIAVSGIASTPFDVAIGGTDFDQAGIQTTFWNSTNGSSSQVSAKGYIPETTWNDSCANAGLTGCNSVTSSSASLNIVAGSGGPSNCIMSSGTTCIAGYPKPHFQTGFGDSARDLPDISLFASDGQNKSFYIVCQSDQDISGDTGCDLTEFTSTTPFHDFQAVGGTSAGAPAFAGIMALVNQKTGQRQGNANVTLYALGKSETFGSCNSSDGTSGSSANTTCVFNDITKGNISVPCSGASANCSKTSSGGFGVVASGGNPAFSTATGYDLATGLGSVNATNLVSKWTTAGATGTATTITLSPSTVSGTVGTVSGNLTGTVSGSGGTPTGVVILENAVSGAPLTSTNVGSGGTYSAPAVLLPAGTYTVKAHYSGDNIFAPKDSAPISVALVKQNSKVIVSFVDGNGSITTANQSVAYGSPYILRIDVANSGGTPCQNVTSGAVNFVCPAGTVSLLDGGVALKDFPNAQTPNASSTATLNDRGFVEDQPIQLNVGVHPITATYAAAASSSYNSNSTSNTLSVTITQATTTTTVTPSPTSITSGGNVILTALVSSGSNSAAGPTGTVQFTSGGSNLGAPATCTPTAASGSTGASCTATLTTALSALPPGFFEPRPRLRPFLVLAWLMLALALLSYRIAMKFPVRERAYGYAGLALFLIAAATLAGCGGGSSSSGGGSSRSISAKYSGETNYAGSTGSTTVTVR
jgi:subtilase family serine protease